MKTYQLYIDGVDLDPVKGEYFDTVDPYRGEVWARIPKASREDVDLAVKAASRAMWDGPWAGMSAISREPAVWVAARMP